MSHCDRLEQYLNRQLTIAEQAAFKRHLAFCSTCSSALRQWDSARTALRAHLVAQSPIIDAPAAQALVVRARQRAPRSWLGRQWPLATATAAAAAAIVLLSFHWAMGGPSTGASQAAFTARSLPLEIVYRSKGSGEERPDLSNGRLSTANDERVLAGLGDARLGLDEGSRLRVHRADSKEILLALESGRLGVRFPPKAGRARLSVTLARIEVAVTGTVFLLERSPDGVLTVAVAKGVVQVTDPGIGHWKVPAGKTFSTDSEKRWHLTASSDVSAQRLALLLEQEPRTAALQSPDLPEADAPPQPERPDSSAGDAPKVSPGKTMARRLAPEARIIALKDPPPKAEPPAGPADMAAVKAWILRGDIEKAEAALRQRLKQDPRHVESLRLLALCQNRSGAPKRAVETLKRIIASGSPAERNRARFRAGVILQDQLGQHAQAVAMFEDYLRETGDRRINAAEASMRMAESVKRSGDTKRYRQILRRVVQEHGGTEAAEQAGIALDGLNSR